MSLSCPRRGLNQWYQNCRGQAPLPIEPQTLRSTSNWECFYNNIHDWPHFLTYTGFCRAYMFASYVSRFVSAWCIVAFTVERYAVICLPLLRRRGAISRRSFARRSLLGVVVMAVLFSIYKPFLVGVIELRGKSQVGYRRGAQVKHMELIHYFIVYQTALYVFWVQ